MGGVGKRRDTWVTQGERRQKRTRRNLVGKWVCLLSVTHEMTDRRHEKRKGRADFWLVLSNQIFLSLPPSLLSDFLSFLCYGMLYKVVCSFRERNTHFWLLGFTFTEKFANWKLHSFCLVCVWSHLMWRLFQLLVISRANAWIHLLLAPK